MALEKKSVNIEISVRIISAKKKNIVIPLMLGISTVAILTFCLVYRHIKFIYIVDSDRYMPGLIALNLMEFLRLWATAAVIIFFTAWLIARLSWKLFLPWITGSRAKKKSRIPLAFTICAMFLISGGWAINRYLLPHKFSPISLAGNTIILFFTVFLGWNIINPGRRITLSIGTAVFILIVFLFESIRSENFPYIETSQEESLRSLPYITWTSVRHEKSGVTKYNPSLSCGGANILFSQDERGAYLLDMRGSILHTFTDKREKRSNWEAVVPYKNGYYIVIDVKGELFMIDWYSNVKWTIKGMFFHHDIAVSDSGDIYAPIYKKTYFFKTGLTKPVRDCYLVILSGDGRIKRNISFAKMIFHNKILFDACKVHQKDAEIRNLYINSIDVIDRGAFFRDKKLFKRGNVLFCIRNLDTIAVIDVEKEIIIWSWGMEELDGPHHPTLLKNGNILIFDNGSRRNYSRVIELNPATGIIEWEFKASPPEAFYSQELGSAQRLPNGNTLIAEGYKGRVFEVTKDKKIVWEFYCPKMDTIENKRATIYRMIRILDLEKMPPPANLTKNTKFK